MTKLQREPVSCKPVVKGYLTVYLTLLLVALIPLYLLIIDGARYNGAKLEASIAVDVGMKSIMAEYHRALYERYDILAIDSSYGYYAAGKYNTEAHLIGYLKKNLNEDKLEISRYIFRDFFGLSVRDAQIRELCILSDGGGAVFRKEAARVAKEKLGLDLFDKVKSWTTLVSISGFDTADYEAEKDKADEELMVQMQNAEKISEQNPYDEKTSNPTEIINQSRRKGILHLVFPDEGELSDKGINTSSLVGYRMHQKRTNSGNMEVNEETSLIEKYAFIEYLMHFFGYYGNNRDNSGLEYQVEYMICGGVNDTDNLRRMANKLLLLREAANVMYLKGNASKMLEIQGMAAVASGILFSPELAPAFERTLLLGWACAESIYDVKNLFAGNRVPLIKNEESWHYGLSAACSGENDESNSKWSGLSYADYLRVFLMLGDAEKLSVRAMDMMEADIRLTEGNALFRIDNCYTKLGAFISVESSFGYDFTAFRMAEY